MQPHELVRRIDALATRLALRARAVSLLWTFAAVVGLLVLFTLADCVLRSPDRGLRWLASAAFIALVAFAAHAIWIRYRQPAPTSLGVAQDLQAHYPQLGSRLASALEFSEQSPEDHTAGSADLRRAVVVGATAEASELDWSAMIDPSPLRTALRAATFCGAVLLGALVWNAQGMATATARLLTPWSNLEWPRQHHLEFVSPPERLARGQNFSATVVNRSGDLPNDARVEYRLQRGGEWSTETQPLQTAGAELLATRENVQRSFEYRAVGGDDTQMAWRQLEVVDPPRLKELKITATPPAYSGLPAGPSERVLRVLEGTQLTVNGSASEALRSAALEIENAPAEALELDAADTAKFTAGETAWQPATVEGKLYTGRYRVRLENSAGLVGTSRFWQLAVVPDSPPEVTWRAPAGDLFITPQAVVSVAASVSDNLAIKSAEFGWRKSAKASKSAKAEEAKPPATERVAMYAGAAAPPGQPEGLATAGERRTVESEWDLASLNLAAGDQLEIVVGAYDYKPQLGRTSLPRRIFLITPEELEQRLAREQTELLAELRRSLALERSANESNRALAIDAAEEVEHSATAQDRLTTLGYEQRKVAASLSAEGGALSKAQSLLSQLKSNRLERPELAAQLEQTAAELRRLIENPLPQADEALTAARRRGARQLEEPTAETAQQLAADLATSGAAQTETIDGLEALVEGLTKWSDFQRFAQEVGELERTQRELAKATARESARAAAAGPLDAMRGRSERAKLSAGQAEVGRRFDKLMQTMQRLLGEAPPPAADQPEAEGKPASSQAVADAVAEAQDRGTSATLRDAAREVASSNFGRAEAQQTAAAEDLKQILDTLRDQPPSDLRKLAQDLKAMEQKLAEMQQQAEPMAKAGAKPDEAQALSEQADRAARQLRRMTAPQAGASAQQASQQMNAAAQGESEQQSAQQAGQAQQNMAQAQQQAAERRKEIEEQLTQQVLTKLATKIGDYQTEQRAVLTSTLKLDEEPKSQPAAPAVGQRQTKLETEILGMAAELAERAVFDLALRGAAGDMHGAAERLAASDVTRPTQQLETAALQRLKHIADVLKQNQEDQKQQPPKPPGAGGQGGQPKPPSPIDLAELKMLRLMQLDLNARTSEFTANLAENREPTADKTALRLAGEQERLSELVEDLVRRNNKAAQKPPAE